MQRSKPPLADQGRNYRSWVPLHQVMVKLKRIHGHMMSIGGSFWDLGAGSGKLVIAAAMMHNFEVST